MICPYCNNEIKDTAKFCPKCGKPVSEDSGNGKTMPSDGFVSRDKPEKGKKRHWLLVLFIAVVVIVALLVVFAIRSQSVDSQYKELIEEGDKYYEENNYEQAETAYLLAIEVKPSEPLPYEKLVDIYKADGELKDAKAIAESAIENVDQNDLEQFEDYLAEINAEIYSMEEDILSQKLENLVIEYEAFESEQESEEYYADCDWADKEGVISAEILDFDSDDDLELFVCIAEEMNNGDDSYYPITMYMYEIEDDESVLQDSMVFAAYDPENADELSLAMNTLQYEVAMISTSILSSDADCYIVCEAYIVGYLFSEALDSEKYWIVNYTGSEFQYMDSMTDSGSEYLEYEFVDGVSDNTVVSHEWAVETVASFFSKYGIKINEDMYRSYEYDNVDSLGSIMSDQESMVRNFEITNQGGYTSENVAYATLDLTRGNDLLDIVAEDYVPVIYILKGQGEETPDSDILSDMSDLGLRTEEFILGEDDELPGDNDIILINCPSYDLSDDEKEMLMEYLGGGASLFYIPLLEPEEEMDHFSEILSYYGMELTGTVIIESDSSRYYQYPIYLLPNVNALDGNVSLVEDGSYVLCPICQGIELSADLRQNLTLTAFITSSDTSYAKEISDLSTYEKEDGDYEGPFVLGAVAEEETDGGNVRIMVITTECLLDASVNSLVSGNNETLFVNGLKWLCQMK